ncbi:MAPEG family protein [Shewanella gelidii]|uniref:Membrane protein n=1 Tax=Shewanella gelidii TaxID=1642821 RepID=A0A917JMM6_9GAMM|nr:MAPEG family protein [Shewanella gelidii]MCL1099283.1 MAPEG family protein [Shewanella gelidii]GGI77722.1 membrane protein [Shewanella gelidii]
MQTLLICLFIAMLLPYVAKGPVGIAMAKLGYDNQHPREQQSQLTGYGARAVAAHHNSFESLIIFGLAVVAVIAAGKANDAAAAYAVVYVVARLAYIGFYLANLSTLRSLVWSVGIFCSFAILWQAI